MLSDNCKITRIGKPLSHMHNLHTHPHVHSHHTWCWSRKENVEMTSLLPKGVFCKQCILGFWCSSVKKAKSFIRNVFFLSPSFQAWVQGAQSLPKPERLDRAEEAVLTAWVYSWKKKAHNVSSVSWLTLETSQLRTKLSQSSCPPWVSGLSSGFIKLLCKGTHQGRLSHKAVGAWPSAHQQHWES